MEKSLGRDPAQVIYGLRVVIYITSIILHLIPRGECPGHERTLAYYQGAGLMFNTLVAAYVSELGKVKTEHH